jgi:hypothetical protein
VLSYYAMIALDVADDRSRELDQRRLERLARDGESEQTDYDWLQATSRPSVLRRGLARGTAAISLGAAAATRRLDDCIADDLGRSLAATD